MNFPVQFPDIKEEHLPIAYAFIALGAIILVKKPSTLMSAVSAYMFWNNLVQKGKAALNP